MATISSAATISVESVRPEIGLFDEPMMPDQVARHGGEEEAEHDHHQRGHEGAGDRLREELVQRNHRDERNRQARQHDLEAQILLRAVNCFGLACGLAEIRHGALQPRGQRLAHAEHGGGRAHQHAAHGDGPHDVAPHLARDAVPGFITRAGRQVLRQLRAEEVDQQRHQQAPGGEAAGEVQRAEPRADDVAHAQIGRSDGRQRELGPTAYGGGACAAQLHRALAQLAHL
jgi:hypothetical protein